MALFTENAFESPPESADERGKHLDGSVREFVARAQATLDRPDVREMLAGIARFNTVPMNVPSTGAKFEAQMEQLAEMRRLTDELSQSNKLLADQASTSRTANNALLAQLEELRRVNETSNAAAVASKREARNARIVAWLLGLLSLAVAFLLK